MRLSTLYVLCGVVCAALLIMLSMLRDNCADRANELDRSLCREMAALTGGG